MTTLHHQHVILTGASSGIGEATALALAERGARVAACARRADRLKALAARAQALPGAILPLECDVTDAASVRAMAERARAAFGPVDALINNAGVMPLSFMDKCHEQEWLSTVEVNIQGVLRCLAAVIPEMVARRSGHIVNVSSVAGRRVFPGAAVYCGTKAFVHALSEGLRSEMVKHNVRVTIIAPGLVRTELQSHTTDPDIVERMRSRPPMRWLEASDIAREIVTVLERPEHVCVNEVLIRPTDQEN